MAIKFLSLFGTKMKKPRPAPPPQGDGKSPVPVPVPEVTAELSVKEDFHDEIAETDAGWFRFNSDSSRLLASMTVSYDITECKDDYIVMKGFVSTPVRIVHTSAMIRLYCSSAVSLATGEGNRCFVVCDRGGSFIDGAPSTDRKFYSLESEGVCLMANYFLNKKIPYAVIGTYPFLSEVKNARITDITIPDEAALKYLVPIY